MTTIHTAARNYRAGLSRRHLLGGGVAGALGLALAACSKSSGGSAASDRAKVTVVTHDSFNVSEDLIKAFTTDTGYELSIVNSGDTGALVNQLVLTKDAPLGDVVYGIDNTYASRALNEGVIDTSATITLPEGVDKYLIDGEAALAPIDMGQVCLNIDSAYFTDNDLTPPATFEDLLNSEYKDLFVAIDPTTSSPGLAWMLATVGHFGADNFADYWKQLVANGTRIVSGWSDAYYTDFSGGDGKGKYPIVVSYTSSPAYTLNEDKTASTTAALLETAFRQVEYAGVLKGAANPEGGKAFVKWMLSREVQEDIPNNMYMYPVSSEASVPPEFEKFAPLAENPVEVPPADITANRAAWLEAWTAAVGK